MPADPKLSAIDPAVLEQLVCPACFGALRLEEKCLVCTGCTLRYPILDGIPVLIADRAENLSLETSSVESPIPE
jgi:uncharacterized protein YbaR (Trm112 family)